MSSARVDEPTWALSDLRELLDTVLEIFGSSHPAQLVAVAPPMDSDGMPHAFVRVQTEDELRTLRREIVNGEWCYFSLDAPSDTSFSFHVRGIHVLGVVES